MTYPDLVTSLYEHFPKLYPQWKRAVAEQGLGALVFLSEMYTTASTFDEVPHDFWNQTRVREYLEQGGLEDMSWEEFLQQLDPEAEFLALILQDPDENDRRGVHLHRIFHVG